MNTNTKTVKKDIVSRVFLVISVVLIVLLLLHSSSGANTDINSDPAPTQSLNIGIDPNAGGPPVERSREEIIAEMNRIVEESNITISMSTEPVFENGTAYGTLNIENDAQNRHAQVVQIYLKDTDELIYQSGMIPVGQWVTQGKLLKDLDAGTYPCSVLFNAVDDDGNVLGQAATNINIRVLN